MERLQKATAVFERLLRYGSRRDQKLKAKQS